MQVQKIEIKNFKAIGQESIEMRGRNVYVLGPNAAGKTSFLDAIFKLLSGKDLPTKLVKAGARQGNVTVDLGDMVAEFAFNAKNEKSILTLTAPDGAKYSAPRTMLDAKIGTLDFDINAFFALPPKKKVDFIKSLVGIEFADLDAEHKRLFDERTFVNRQVKELCAVVDSYTCDFEKTVEIDLSAVQVDLEQAQQFNQKINDILSRQQQRVARWDAIRQQIADLKREEEELADLNDKATAWLGQNQPVDLSAIRAVFDSALIHNNEVAKTLRAHAEMNKLQTLEAKQADLNTALANIEQVKKDEIAAANLPVPGLTFDDDGLYLNGLPFEQSQINTAQQIIAGLQINLALMKEVKIARFDGSLLDNKNLAEVEAWASENGVQLFVEMVQRDGEGLQIEVREEGES